MAERNPIKSRKQESKLTLTSILPDLLGLAEAAFGPGQGAQKQQAVIAAVATGLTDAKVPNWLIVVLTTLLGVAIPALVNKYNADPSNTTFTKP